MKQNAKVAIVTDTTSCLPAELCQEYGIRIVPVGMVIEGKFYRDVIDIQTPEFLAMFNSLKEQPSTTAVNPGDFLKVFEELSEQKFDIICILVSKVLSATQECAYQAKRLIRSERPGINIEIVDSRTSSGALGFIALEAGKAAKQGKNMAEVLQVVQDMKMRVICLSAVESLKYLIKIGRAPRNITSFGEILQIKPIIGFVDDTGLIEIVARLRGTQKALAKMIDLVDKYAERGKPLHAMIHYTDGTSEVEEIKKMLSARYHCAEILVARYPPVTIAACGPCIGLSFYS